MKSPTHFQADSWDQIENRLWKPQREAISLIRDYMKKPASADWAALVRMPTGTGKTGIMAVAANLLPSVRITLIVSPSEYLTRQISLHVTSKFWETIDAEPKGGPRPAHAFVPSSLTDFVGKDSAPQVAEPMILICTMQALQLLHQTPVAKQPDWQPAFERLKAAVDLVLVDEGHREPANSWARAIRSLGKPTVLFSATPYRNDLRFFRVGAETDGFRQRCTYHDAVQQNLVRPVRLVAWPETAGRSPQAFVKQLCDYYFGDFQKMAPKQYGHPKVIVRCETFDAIKQIREELIKQLASRSLPGVPMGKLKVGAVHDQYKKDDKTQGTYAEVPFCRPDGGDGLDDTVFWVHQFRLTEGLDDPSFSLLAVYQPFGNARSLVQQIGRIIRNPSLGTAEEALVAYPEKSGCDRQWQGYLSFEKADNASADPQEIVARLLAAMPSWTYLLGEFRSAAVFDDTTYEKVRVRRSAEIYEIAANVPALNLKEIAERLSDLMADRDCVEFMTLERTVRNGSLVLMAHWNVMPSPNVAEEAFFNVSLTITILYRTGDLLFYQGAVAGGIAMIRPDLTPVDPDKLQRLLGGGSCEVKSASLVNCDLGSNSVRRRTIGAYSLADSAPALNDHLHFASALTGSMIESGERRRKYVGMVKGRVSYLGTDPVSVEDYTAWADGVAAGLRDSTRSGPDLLTRYAQYMPPPAGATAAHILIDLREFASEFAIDGGWPDRDDDQYLAVAADVTGGSFSCQIAEQPVTGTVRYEKPKFVIDSADLNKLCTCRDGNRHQNRKPSSFITNEATVRIVTTDRDLYADGRFYRPRRGWDAERLVSLEVLSALPALGTVPGGEKGNTNPTSTCWSTNCLFGIIDHHNNFFAAGDEPEYLVCEDLGTESCDFIALNSDPKRIVMIHAKMGEAGSPFSASAFQVVQAQAVKNLEMLNPYATDPMRRASKWGDFWNNTRIRRIRQRPGRRHYSHAATEAQELFEALLRDPETDRQVWIVFGQAFPVGGLTSTLSAALAQPPYHLVQLVYLIESLTASVAAMGARLTIFSRP